MCGLSSIPPSHDSASDKKISRPANPQEALEQARESDRRVALLVLDSDLPESLAFESEILSRSDIQKALSGRISIRVDLPMDRDLTETLDIEEAPTILLFSRKGKETWRAVRPQIQTLLHVLQE